MNFQAELQEFKRRCKINLALRDEALAKVGEEQKALEQVQTDLQVVSAALGGAAVPPQIEATSNPRTLLSFSYWSLLSRLLFF